MPGLKSLRAKAFYSRLRLEILEDRLAPATGVLDTSFDNDGKNSVGFNLGQAKDDTGADVAAQSDGKYVVVGTVQRATAGDTDFGVARFNRNGTLDTTFNTTGKRQIAFDLGGDLEDRAAAVVIQPDGKIIVVGYAQTGATNGYDFAVARINPDGTLDTTFDGDGKQSISFNIGGSKDDICTDVILQPDGKIVLTGQASFTNDRDYAVVRLNSDGSLDTTFSSDGKATFAFDLGGLNNDYAEASVLQSDGKIIVAGWSSMPTPQFTDASILRLNSDGSLDTTFGSSGKFHFSYSNIPGAYDRIDDVALTQDGKIVVAGWTQSLNGTDFDYAVAQLTSSGSLDSTFGSNGTVIVGFNFGGNNWDAGKSVIVQPDGKILVSGYSDRSAGGDQDFTIIRLNPTGSLDTSFSNDGKHVIAIDLGGNLEDQAYGMVLVSDGIVLAGSSQTAANGKDFSIVRLIRDQWVITSADIGGPPVINIFTPTGTLLYTFYAYGSSFTGGVRVATGEINGDGVPDIFCAPGPTGAPFVNIFDGRTFSLIRSIQVYGASFTLGVNIAVGDVQGDGIVELLTAPDVGGAPYVNVFNPTNGAFIKQLLVYGVVFTAGVRVSTGDFTGDAKKEILVAPQAGGAPIVNVFDGTTSMLVKQFQVFGSAFFGGIYIAAGNVNNAGKDDLIVGPGFTGAPYVNIFDGDTKNRIKQFLIFGTSFTVGVRVGAVDADSDGDVDVIAAPGQTGSPVVKVKNSDTGTDFGNFPAYDATMTSGLFVVGGTR